MVQAFYLYFLLVKFSLKLLKERIKTEFMFELMLAEVMADKFNVTIKYNTHPKALSLYNIITLVEKNSNSSGL